MCCAGIAVIIRFVSVNGLLASKFCKNLIQFVRRTNKITNMFPTDRIDKEPIIHNI